MLKFWKSGCRRQVKEFEDYFISEGNRVDNELLEFSKTKGRISNANLGEIVEICWERDQMVQSNYASYRSLFIFGMKNPPDYGKLVQRTEALAKMALGEFGRRNIDASDYVFREGLDEDL